MGMSAHGGADAEWSEHGAVLVAPGAVGDAGDNWVDVTEKTPAHFVRHGIFVDSGSTKGLEASWGSEAFRFRSP